MPDLLRVGEIVDMYRSFYEHPIEDDLMEAFGPGDKRRSVVLALIGSPRPAVLDEMTTGLDPQARHDTWDVIKRVRERGTAVLLVTHFMEEATGAGSSPRTPPKAWRASRRGAGASASCRPPASRTGCSRTARKWSASIARARTWP